MFGISDPGIWLAYLLELLCLVFAVWYGIKYWNQDDGDESSQQTTDPLKPKTSKSTKPAKKHSHN
ncbi:MAG: hypothetical protein PHE04_03585 [Bacteroidales bacterium]|nr:hypothetical protein [Bacteroidales bacterium]MDD3430493.1 hypothetical protein [Bacteroidales bacterium]MDD4429815.1 hypothetical protein [Bacteroidales bacterium]